jgi:hypothetical protein
MLEQIRRRNCEIAQSVKGTDHHFAAADGDHATVLEFYKLIGKSHGSSLSCSHRDNITVDFVVEMFYFTVAELERSHLRRGGFRMFNEQASN